MQEKKREQPLIQGARAAESAHPQVINSCPSTGPASSICWTAILIVQYHSRIQFP